jgi:hypothetical protein
MLERVPVTDAAASALAGAPCPKAAWLNPLSYSPLNNGFAPPVSV